MRNFKMVMNSFRKLTVLSLAASAVTLTPLGTKAVSINVYVDPTQVWNGYETVYTNGLVSTTGPSYMSDWLGTGNTFPNQASIMRLVGAILLEQNDEWQLQHRYMTLETMTGLGDEQINALPWPNTKAA